MVTFCFLLVNFRSTALVFRKARKLRATRIIREQCGKVGRGGAAKGSRLSDFIASVRIFRLYAQIALLPLSLDAARVTKGSIGAHGTDVQKIHRPLLVRWKR